MKKEEFLKEIENVPKINSINPISSYNSINVEDLANAVERFNKIPNCEELLKENQELKKHLEVPEPCNLKTLEDYKSYYEDTTKEQILADTYIDYCAYVNLAHEYVKLKKQLEEKIKIGVADHKYASNCEDKVITMENQQKEFIEYINEKIDICDGFIDTIRSDLEEISCGGRIAGKTYIANKIMENEVAKKILEEILSKYKEIIGGKDE